MAKKPKKKTLSQIKSKVWEIFSLYVRLTNADENGFVTCYTCGRKDLVKYMQAGHGIGGRHGAVLFNPFIVRPQCFDCNVINKGEYERFAAKLTHEFGQEWYDDMKLHSSKSSSRVVKYTFSEYEEIAEFCREEIKARALARELIPKNIENFWPTSKDMGVN